MLFLNNTGISLKFNDNVDTIIQLATFKGQIALNKLFVDECIYCLTCKLLTIYSTFTLFQCMNPMTNNWLSYFTF